MTAVGAVGAVRSTRHLNDFVIEWPLRLETLTEKACLPSATPVYLADVVHAFHNLLSIRHRVRAAPDWRQVKDAVMVCTAGLGCLRIVSDSGARTTPAGMAMAGPAVRQARARPRSRASTSAMGLRRLGVGSVVGHDPPLGGEV